MPEVVRKNTSLKDFVQERGDRVDSDRARIRQAPDQEQRVLAPIAKGGGLGIYNLLASIGIDLDPLDGSDDSLSAVMALYDVTNYTELRVLDASTATLNDVLNLLSTFVMDVKRISEG